MERVIQNKKILEAILKEYQPRFQYDDDTVTSLVIDPETQHYQLLRYGWATEHKFIHYAIFSLFIKNGKIWLLENRTDTDIVEELMRRGVDKMDIVLGFIPEDERQYTEFAVA
ncbi:MAG: element excision factor XisI family protein [Bacteroidota bacterium]